MDSNTSILPTAGSSPLAQRRPRAENELSTLSPTSGDPTVKLASRIAPVMILLLAIACRGAAPAKGPQKAGGVAVRTAPVTIRDVVYEIRALGSLEAPERVQVVAEVEGAVSEVLFNEGLHASPKTVLARIDPERFRLAAEQAEAVLRQAESDSDRAKADLARREALAKEELLSVEELNRVRAETGRLRAVAEAARAARDIALQNRTRSEVRAPGGGVIDTRTVDTGQYVRMGTVLATLVDTSRLRLRCKVSDAESMRAAVGQDVSFRIAALGSRDFPARIYHVGSVADPATRQVEVLAWAPNPGLLRPGFFAEVHLAAESHKGATVVPESAVLATDAGFVAYVVEKGKASLRKVEIGLRTGDGSVEILSGLASGDTVIVEGSDRLADGVPVVTGSTGEEAKK